MMDRMRSWSWKRWLAIAVVGAAIAALGGPFVYIHFVEGKAPAPLGLTTPAGSSSATQAATSTSQGSGATDGAWKVGSDSIVGYRIKEVLFGQSNVAVGRTSDITGSITVDGTTISAGTFTVDMTTVTSDESRRDGQFNGRIMETSTYPTATFTLTQPIDFGQVPAIGVKRTFQATGELTLHGVTKPVTFQVTGQYMGSAVQVVGSIPITFADYAISNPSFGPVTTEDHGILEFSLNFAHA
jgi:polyisoprenoid-binding protein YceI